MEIMFRGGIRLAGFCREHIPFSYRTLFLTIKSFRLAFMMLALVCVPLLCLDVAAAGTIDDFEDGVINTGVWAIGQGNYAGGTGFGIVSESNGQLVLDCTDDQRYGAGVAAAVLRDAYVGVPVLFSFDLSIEDTSFADTSYIPRISFEVSSLNTADYVTGVGHPKEIVYDVKHDQLATNFAISGVYYFFIDPIAQEARLYDNSDDSLLGSVSYAHFGGDPYIAFNAYTDVDQGMAHTIFKLNEVIEVPEPTTLVLLGMGYFGVMYRHRV